VDWTCQAVKVIGRWLGRRPWVLVGDEAYACLKLGWTGVERQVVLISRFCAWMRSFTTFRRRWYPAGAGVNPRKGPD